MSVPRSVAAVAVGLFAGGAVAPQPATFPVFERHHVDAIGSQLGQTALADIDKDGDLDWIAGTADRVGGTIWWWQDQGPTTWVRHVLGTGRTDVGGALHDVNGDGWLDMLSGSRLLLSTGRPRTEPFRAYDVGTAYSHDTIFADVDGDRRLDAVAKLGSQRALLVYGPRRRDHGLAVSHRRDGHRAQGPRRDCPARGWRCRRRW